MSALRHSLAWPFNYYNKWGGTGLSSSVDKTQDKRWDGLGSSSNIKGSPTGHNVHTAFTRSRNEA